MRARTMVGACYENECSEQFLGGWSTIPFGVTTTKYENQVFDWWVNSGTTMSNRDFTGTTSLPCNQVVTGPCVDQTTGTSSGKYLYAEASGCFGRTIAASTPTFTFTSPNTYLSFWYFMYGADYSTRSFDNALLYYPQDSLPGSLEVLMYIATSSGSFSSTVVWSLTGQQQTSALDPWQNATISLDAQLPNEPSTSQPVTVYFTFQATIGGWRSLTVQSNTWMSDVAIDGVLVTQDGLPQTTPKPVNDISPAPNGDSSTTSAGLSSAEIGSIVGSIVGGFALLALALALLVVTLLLIISPRKPTSSQRLSEP